MHFIFEAIKGYSSNSKTRFPMRNIFPYIKRNTFIINKFI